MYRTLPLLILVACATAPSADEPSIDTPVVHQTSFQTPDGPMTVSWVDHEGYAITGGDIIIGKTAELLSRGAHGFYLYHPAWDAGIIPYSIDPTLPDAWRVELAVDRINQATDLNLVERTTESDYLVFEPDPSECASRIGRVGGPQVVRLSSWCDPSDVLHEIGHAAGLVHEHQRPDRDQHVDVFYQCIRAGLESQFERRSWMATNFGPYDHESLMHYHSKAGLKFPPGGCTATILDKNGGAIARATDLSPLDIKALDALAVPQFPSLGLLLPFETTPGETITIAATNVVPGERAWLVGSPLGMSEESRCPAVWEGLCVSLAGNPQFLGSGIADQNGDAEVSITVPLNFPTDVLGVQMATASNSGVAHSAAIDLPVRATLTTCPTGEFVDCGGRCSDYFLLGDGVCDDSPLADQPNWDCSMFNYDLGDCSF